jgi:GNAT superfamily N-acetyltransferase
MSLRVSRADSSRIEQTLRLFEGYLDFYKCEPAPEKARAFILDRLTRQDSVIFLAELDGACVGFTQLYPAFASLSMAPNWILNDLYVEPAGRGKGVATALMEAARQLAVDTGAAEVFLQTARDNRTAQSLYEGLGYKRDDEFLVYILPLPKA